MIKLFFLLFFLIVGPVYADSISGVSGDLDHGAIITVTGTWSSKSDENVSKNYHNKVWDNFDNGVVDDNFTNTNKGLANNVTAVTSNPRHGFSDYSARKITLSGNAATYGISIDETYSTQSFYTSFWMLRPSGTTWNYSGQPQEKQLRIGMVGNEGIYPNMTSIKHEQSPTDDPHLFTVERGVAGYRFYHNNFWEDGQWHRMEVYFEASSGVGNVDGKYQHWLDGVLVVDDNAVRTDEDGHNTYNGRWAVVPYLKASSTDRWIDDVYFSHTRERWELCQNNPTNQNDKGHCEIQIPRSWGTNTATLEVNLGSLTGTVYLIKYQSDGTFVKYATALTVGGSSGGGGGATDETPPVISNVSPSDGTTGYSLTANSDPFISFRITDNESGIDDNTIAMDVRVGASAPFLIQQSLDISPSLSHSDASVTQAVIQALLGRDLTEGDNISADLRGSNGDGDPTETTITFTMEETASASNAFALGDIGNLDNYTIEGQGTVDVISESGNLVVSITDNSLPIPADQTVSGILVYDNEQYPEFDFSAQLRYDQSLDPLSDFALVFGYKDSENYFYWLINRNTTYHRIYQVVDGLRTQLDGSNQILIIDNDFHTVRATYYNKTLRVYFDGVKIMQVNDVNIPKGKVGFGSYDQLMSGDDPVLVELTEATGHDNNTNTSNTYLNNKTKNATFSDSTKRATFS